jgi:hypothetical protein
LSKPEVFVQSSIPAISCAHAASRPAKKPNTAILNMLLAFRAAAAAIAGATDASGTVAKSEHQDDPAIKPKPKLKLTE